MTEWESLECSGRTDDEGNADDPEVNSDARRVIILNCCNSIGSGRFLYANGRASLIDRKEPDCSSAILKRTILVDARAGDQSIPSFDPSEQLRNGYRFEPQ